MPAEPTSAPRLNKHELRTRETRDLLLRAAETIFIRDGYEGAELGEIATLAGRTKGAIYGHFKSKEDIFIAMMEQHRENRRARMIELMAFSTGVEDNIAAFRKFYMECTQDQGWAILMMEFKLFTLRHPDARKRLQEFRDQTYGVETKYATFLGRVAKGKKTISRTLSVHTIMLMLSALLLEKQVAPEVLSDEDLLKIMERLFDTFIETP